MARAETRDGMVDSIPSEVANLATSDQLILRDLPINDLLDNRSLPLSYTKYTTGLCLPHVFPRPLGSLVHQLASW